MPTISTRLDQWLDAEIRRFWEARGEGPSTGMRRMAREWWALEQFPAIEFRDGPAGRRAGIRGGPDVWEIALLMREYGQDVDAIHGHLGGRIAVGAIQQAFAYIEHFREEIEAWLRENDRMEVLLRQATAG